jgi:hypothetical protein
VRADGYTIALDSNAYRRRAGEASVIENALQLARQYGGRIVVPDAVLLEQGKSEEWRRTYVKTFAIVRDEPHRFASSVQRGPALSFEAERGVPVPGVVHAGPALIHALASDDRAVVDAVADRIEDARRACDPRVDARRSRDQVGATIELWRKILDRADLNALRAGRLGPAHVLADPGLADVFALASAPFDHDAALALLQTRSFLACTWYTLAATALRWLIVGGFETLKLHEHVNEALDREIVEIALLCDEFRTSDRRPREVYGLVNEAFDIRFGSGHRVG